MEGPIEIAKEKYNGASFNSPSNRDKDNYNDELDLSVEPDAKVDNSMDDAEKADFWKKLQSKPSSFLLT